MKRRVHLDDRGVPYSQSVELSGEDIQRQQYSLLRLILFLPLIGLGLFAGAKAETLNWHPMFPIAIGLSVPIIGGFLLHVFPLVRMIYDCLLTLALAVAAFAIVRDTDGADIIWASGASLVAVLIGAWVTMADLRGSNE